MRNSKSNGVYSKFAIGDWSRFYPSRFFGRFNKSDYRLRSNSAASRGNFNGPYSRLRSRNITVVVTSFENTI